MLLNQEGFSSSPSLQGNSKPRGQRSLEAAMEAICLVVTAQQVSPGWGTRLLKTSHPSRKKNSTTGSISGMSTTHGHSLTTHVTTTRVYPYSTPCSHYTVCFVASERRLPPAPHKKMLKQWGEKNGKNNRGHRRCTARCLFLFECHRVKFFFPLSLVEGDSRAAPVLRVPPDW